MDKNKILKEVEKYYTDKILEYGATSKGVDWNGLESHHRRFEQFSKLLPSNEKFSLLDYGSGFGSIIPFLEEHGFDFSYYGFDISEEMVKKGQELFENKDRDFKTVLPEHKMGYTIANGIFNVKLHNSNEDWLRYIEETIETINNSCSKGFAFNILTSYSDKEYMKDYLYYADPLYFFDLCKKKYSRNVALLHDYELYEFTLIVRK